MWKPHQVQQTTMLGTSHIIREALWSETFKMRNARKKRPVTRDTRWWWYFLLLPLQCNDEIRERQLWHLQDYALTAELKTGWLFLLHLCFQSQSRGGLMFHPGDLVIVWITSGDRDCCIRAKTAWITGGPL